MQRAAPFGRRRFGQLDGAAVLGGLLPAATSAASAAKVALVLTRSISDGGWSQQAYKGLQRVKAGGGPVAFIENVKQSDIPQVVRGYADDGYDLVIGYGFQFGSLFMELAHLIRFCCKCCSELCRVAGSSNFRWRPGRAWQ